MIITNNDLNSMPQQVEENKKNIKILAQYLKEAYKTPNDIGDSAVSIAISDTNATADTTNGWLITHDGYLYHITSGDGTNLLLDYYTRLRGNDGTNGINGTDGVDGTDGIDGYSFRFCNTSYIDDNTNYNYSDLIPSDNILVNDNVMFKDGTIATITSFSDDYSIFRVSKLCNIFVDESLINVSTYYTLVQPTYVNPNYTLDLSDLANANNTNPRVNDIVLYVDSDDKVKEMYKITLISSNTITLDKVGDVGGGKQLYQHNLRVKWKNNNDGLQCFIIIINDDSTQFDFTKLAQFVDSKANDQFYAWGRADGTTAHQIYAIGYYTVMNTDYLRFYYLNENGSGGATNPQDATALDVIDEVLTI